MPKKAIVKKSARNKKVNKILEAKTEKPQKATSTLGSYLQIIKNFASRKTYYIFLLVTGILILVFVSGNFLVVAWVDKQPISRIEYLQELDKKYGKELKDQLIIEKLLSIEARKKQVLVSENEILEEIKKVEQSQGGAEQLNQILQIQGIKQDEFKKMVKLQILKQKVFGRDVVISDDEINKYLETNKEQFKDPDDKVRESIKEQLKQQKINSNFQNFIKDSLNGPRVIRVEGLGFSRKQ